MPEPSSPAERAPGAAPLLSPRVLVALLLLSGLAAYANTFAVPFFFDDLTSISENPHIERLWPIVAPGTTTLASRPAVAFSLALNYALGGRSVGGYHLFNLLLHLLSGLLLFGIVRRSLDAAANDGSSTPTAFAVSLLWLLHPLQTEAVTYVIQRTELMMAFSLLLALYALLRASEEPQHSFGFSILTIAACALGMASKEVMVTAPVLLLLFDRIYLAGSWQLLWAKRRWLHLGVAGTWVILLLLVYPNPRQASVGFHFDAFGPWAYAKTQVSVVLHYLRLTLFPHPLVIDYGDWHLATRLWPLSWAPVALLVGLLGATGVALLRWPRLGFLGAWFFVILAPTSSVLPIVTELAAERRVYLSSAAVIVLVVLATRALLRRAIPDPRSRHLVATLLLLLVGSLALLRTHQRNAGYQDRITIWTRAVADVPANARAHLNLAIAYLEAGQRNKALPRLREAVRLDPYYAGAHTALGGVLGQLGQFAAAERHLRLALAFDPRDHRAQANHGALLAQTGRPKQAVAALKRALELGGRRAEVLLNLAQARAMLGDLSGAERDARAALKRRPHDVGALRFLAKLLVRTRRPGQASVLFQRALRLRSKDATLWNDAGVARASAGDLVAAIAHFRRALGLAPNYADARRNLERALQARGAGPR